MAGTADTPTPRLVAPETAGHPQTEQISGRQKTILQFIRDHIATAGYPPTVREIGKHAGLASTASVHRHIRILEDKGFIKRGTAGHSRTVVLAQQAA